MVTHLSWGEVERALDEVEQHDKAGVVEVFQRFEGMALDARDMRGARQTVNVSTFCHRFGLGRGTFARWIRQYGQRETA